MNTEIITPTKLWYTSECLKHKGEGVYRSIYNRLQDISKGETLPDQWKRGVNLLIHKITVKKKCIRYRRITLKNTYLVIANILLNVEGRTGGPNLFLAVAFYFDVRGSEERKLSSSSRK